ncbi:oocyte-secreted protein 3-like [Marmota monax]|uniref:oocyte-secreted protein 3-like n=1 Tax=Marmota monax TaxID=9995 RepID=UPI0026F08554|nr:oocyte-secreted protein 3-like [Marmota monax]
MEEELASQNPRGKAIYVQGAVKRVSTSLSQKEVVLVECSHHNFRVVVNRALFYEDELIGPDELFLGTGCVAIHVRPNELEFDYPVSLCGIVPQVFYDGSVFHSWLTYRPRNQVISTELHLQCLVPRSVQNITGSLPEYQ